MKKNRFPLLLLSVLAAFFVGCQTRSISNSGYERNYAYRGELSELSVLGVESAFEAENTEALIQKALEEPGRIQLRPGDRITLIQSGASFPDDAMMAEMEEFYDVVPLSGIPPQQSQRNWHHETHSPDERPQLDQALRLASARAGAKTMIVCWGILETARESYVTKTVSWTPILGSLIPDENQSTRIRLKTAVVDVATGHWEILTPSSFEDERTTAGINRRNQDQDQVGRLKSQAYERLVEDLATRFHRRETTAQN